MKGGVHLSEGKGRKKKKKVKEMFCGAASHFLMKRREAAGDQTHTHTRTTGRRRIIETAASLRMQTQKKKATTRVLDRCVMPVIIDLALLVCVILSVILEHSSSFGFNRFKIDRIRRIKTVRV